MEAAFDAVESGWSLWASRYEGAGEWSDIVLRSLITLKALTHFDTGGIVAAPTTSLPEQLGGSRNWDYRFCWLRDATLTLYALMESNFIEEANAWQQWLLRAVAGSPASCRSYTASRANAASMNGKSLGSPVMKNPRPSASAMPPPTRCNSTSMAR